MLHHAKNAGVDRDERPRRSSLHEILGHAPRRPSDDDVFGTTVCHLEGFLHGPGHPATHNCLQCCAGIGTSHGAELDEDCSCPTRGRLRVVAKFHCTRSTADRSSCSLVSNESNESTKPWSTMALRGQCSHTFEMLVNPLNWNHEKSQNMSASMGCMGVTTSVGMVSNEPSKFACVIDTDQPDKISPLSTLLPSTLNPYPYPPPHPPGPDQPGRNEYLLERSQPRRASS